MCVLYVVSNKGDSPTHTIAVGAAESEHLLVDDEERGDDDSVCRQRPSNHLVQHIHLYRITDNIISAVFKYTIYMSKRLGFV